MKQLIIILSLLPYMLFSQQREVITCPYDAMYDTGFIAQKFVAELDTQFNVTPDIFVQDGDTFARAVLYMPKEPMYFGVNDSFLLYAQGKQCITSGIRYYVYASTNLLDLNVPDTLDENTPLFIDYLKNIRYSEDGTKILANIPYRGSFLSHGQAVTLAAYLLMTSQGRLINRKEWDEINEREFEQYIIE